MRWEETLSSPRPGAHCASVGRALRSQFPPVASAAMPLVGTIVQNTAIQEQIFSDASLGFAPNQGIRMAQAETVIYAPATARRRRRNSAGHEPTARFRTPAITCRRKR